MRLASLSRQLGLPLLLCLLINLFPALPSAQAQDPYPLPGESEDVGPPPVEGVEFPPDPSFNPGALLAPGTPAPVVPPAPPPSGLPPADFVPEPLRQLAEEQQEALAMQARLERGPLNFVPNQGQFDAAVRAQVQSQGATIFFTPEELVLSLPNSAPTHEATAPRDAEERGPSKRLGATQLLTPSVARLQFAGATQSPEVVLEGRLPGIFNYYYGNDPDQWHVNVPSYAGVRYRQLYPGVDVLYEGQQGALKSTYYVAPGADAAQIRWRYSGVSETRLDAEGNLQLTLPIPNGARTEDPAAARTLTEQTPVAWQDLNGQRVPVTVGYQLGVDGHVSFALGSYDHSRPLVIDPVISYSTYVGGNGSETAVDIAVDRTGAIYITGETTSTNFPGTTGGTNTTETDVFVSKLNPSGSRKRSTSLGLSSSLSCQPA